jgi:hypothetical protein
MSDDQRPHFGLGAAPSFAEPSCDKLTDLEVTCTLQNLKRGADYTITFRNHDRNPPRISSTDIELEDEVHSVVHDLLYWSLPGAIIALLGAFALMKTRSPALKQFS